MNNNTIFDDVFRTMVEKMTYLLVPLINEVFHTSYPEDVKIVHLRNEHQLEDGELITDARLLIGDKVYHIECQSTDDATMAIRMFEYDLAIALESRRRVGRRFFPSFLLGPSGLFSHFHLRCFLFPPVVHFQELPKGCF